MSEYFKKIVLGCMFLIQFVIFGDIGLFELQSDRVYYTALGEKHSHSQQYYDSSDIDFLNVSTQEKIGFGSFSFFHPTLFTSFNSSIPSGINDGAIWQGKGFNGQFETGVIFNSKYLNIRLIPKFWITQNSDFDIVPSIYNSEASERGKYGSIISGLDNFQRPGNNYYYDYDIGKTSVLLKLSIFEFEFSTDNFVLGPSRISPLIMNDNSSGFPHLKLGFNKWETKLGIFEYNAFGGMLEESKYFDNNPDNDNTLITGLCLAYSPSILPGFTFGFNRTLIAPMSEISPAVVFKVYDPFIFGGIIGEPYGYDKTDQRVSFVIDWSFPESGLKIYAEFGKNDYSTDYELFLRTPEHASGITAGLSKVLGKYLLEFEYTELIESRDYTIGALGSGGTFYRHGIVTQGYTNKGQVLGAAIGAGSDAQTLSCSYFGERHQVKGFIQRIGIDKDYIYGNHYAGKLPTDPENPYGVDRLQFDLKLGVKALYNINQFIIFSTVSTGFRFNYNFQPDKYMLNFYAAIGLQYKL